MNEILKKRNSFLYLIPLLVILLVMPGNLLAAKSLKVEVVKLNGEAVTGLLIDVDVTEKWVVVKPEDALTGTRIYTKDMKEIITYNTKVGRKAANGFLGGLGIGLLFTIMPSGDDGEGFASVGKILIPITFGLIGLVFGSAEAAANKKRGKRILIVTESPKKVNKILKKLKKKAKR